VPALPRHRHCLTALALCAGLAAAGAVAATPPAAAPQPGPAPLTATAASETLAPQPGSVAALVQESQRQARIAPAESRWLAEQALQRLATDPDADLALRAHLLLCEHHAEGDRASA
jgi:hypothetical protein